MKWSLRRKLLVALLLPTFLTALVVLVSHRGLAEVTQSYEALTEETEQSLTQALKLEEAVTDQARAMTAYVATLETSNRLDFEAATSRMEEALAWLKEHARIPEAQEMVQRVEQAYQAYRAESDRIITLTWIAPEDVRQIVAGLRSLREPLTGALTEYVEFQEKQVQDVHAAVQEQAATTGMILIGVSALALLISVAGALILSRAITRPILTVARAAEQLAAGNLTTGELAIESQDEVGAVAAAFNRMAQDLRQLIAGIAQSTEAVLTTASELASASEQSAQAAQEAAQEVTSVARGTSEQARSAEAASRRVAQLQQTLQQIADGAGKSAAEVQQAAELLARAVTAVDRMASDAETMAASAGQVAAAARSGAEAVDRTMDGMVRIRTAVEATAASIARLERLSAQIGEITVTISTIADQTNLLALNAAIEAARAGENGRGFAVVADEVRKLAEQTSASAQEISQLIDTIQGQTAQAVESMRGTAAEVQSGHATALQAGQQLREILTMVESSIRDIQRVAQAAQEVKAGAPRVAAAFDSVSALSEENTAATEEIAAGAREVTDGVTAIAGIAQANAASAEQLSASIQQLSAASEQVAFSAQELESVAKDLQERVSAFKL